MFRLQRVAGLRQLILNSDRRGLEYSIPHTPFNCLTSKLEDLPAVRLSTLINEGAI
jgi:hypothetical protein